MARRAAPSASSTQEVVPQPEDTKALLAEAADPPWCQGSEGRGAKAAAWGPLRRHRSGAGAACQEGPLAAAPQRRKEENSRAPRGIPRAQDDHPWSREECGTHPALRRSLIGELGEVEAAGHTIPPQPRPRRRRRRP